MFWQELGLLKPIFNKKCLIFSLYFSFISIFANTCIKSTQFNLFYQYMLLLTKVKTFLNLLNIKEKYVLLFSCDFPIRYVNGCPESKILSLQYPYLQLLIQTSQFYMGSWHKLLKSKHLFFNITLPWMKIWRWWYSRYMHNHGFLLCKKF